MRILRRVALVFLLTGAVVATLILDPILRQCLIAQIKSPALVDALSWMVRLTVWSIPMILWPQRWELGSHGLRWTPTLFLVLPYALLNLVFFRGFPGNEPWLWTLLVALAVAGWEEMVFRGYALSKCGAHPRFAICLSAMAFALLHWYMPLANIITAFFVGIGFGVLQVTSGSLGSCIIIHALTNALSVGANPPDWAIIPVALLTTAATLLALLRHPYFHGRAELPAYPSLSHAPRT